MGRTAISTQAFAIMLPVLLLGIGYPICLPRHLQTGEAAISHTWRCYAHPVE
jgi:hypothetical protein